MIDIDEIKKQMKAKWMGKEILFFEETESTNVEAGALAGKGAKQGTLVVTDSQTGGKGRRGRVWHTSPNTSIAMSYILKPQLEAEYASMLTLVQAMAVAKAIEEVCGLETRIKWPNDILVNEKKVCGILTEMNLDGSNIASVIIGTGINVNQEEFPMDIIGLATSLKRESKELQCREKIIAVVCEKFEFYYDKFVKCKDLSFMAEEYNNRLISVGRRVNVLDPKGEFAGEALGINLRGELMVRTEKEEVVHVYAGEVSVRGIYGYV